MDVYVSQLCPFHAVFIWFSHVCLRGAYLYGLPEATKAVCVCTLRPYPPVKPSISCHISFPPSKTHYFLPHHLVKCCRVFHQVQDPDGLTMCFYRFKMKQKSKPCGKNKLVQYSSTLKYRSVMHYYSATLCTRVYVFIFHCILIMLSWLGFFGLVLAVLDLA